METENYGEVCGWVGGWVCGWMGGWGGLGKKRERVRV